MQKLRLIRYYFEILSVPVFLFLVAHMSGFAFVELFMWTEWHGLHAGHWHDHGNHGSWYSLLFELGIGILVTAVFVWIWHRPLFKKLVPCSHEHCHDHSQEANTKAQNFTHIIAIIALCIHFFPEAHIRHELLESFEQNGRLTLQLALASVWFFFHFLIDVILVVFISLYWKSTWQRVISLVVIVTVWIISWNVWLGELLESTLLGEYIVALLGAFFLAMFIHWPHKPKMDSECRDCCEHS